MAMLIAGAGCSTVPGPFNGLGNDEMSMLAITTWNGTPPTPEQYRVVADIARKQASLLGWQLSSAAESIVISGLVGGAAGAAGGSTQGLIYTFGSAGSAAAYTAAVYGLGYMVNGAITASYANVYAVAYATELALRDNEKYGDDKTKKILKGVHVVAAFIRSGNSHEKPAGALSERMNWSGSTVGTR